MVGVFAGQDLDESIGVMINAWPITPDQKTPVHPPMATDRVTFAGEVVAVVVARSAAAARDAAELVDVDYEELPAALDLRGGRRGQGAGPSRSRHQQVGALGLRLR